MQSFTIHKRFSVSPEQIFMLSVLLVNGGNYVYNLVLGRLLGPEQFADAAVLITFLLVLSFVAMTYQLVTAKFSVEFEERIFGIFKLRMFKQALCVGLALGILIFLNASQLQSVFNTANSTMFKVFGLGVPIYFMMSVNRGVFQGQKAFKNLSITYQLEMISRLIITLGLLFLLNIQSSVIVALGIFFSFAFGMFPLKFDLSTIKSQIRLKRSDLKMVRRFFVITVFYELTQIIINNSDILLVKHYFDAYEAGLYASLALIGRVVYFVAWMFVMVLLPTVIQNRKEGKSTYTILMKYVLYVFCLAVLIVLVCAVIPEFTIQLLFGEQYLPMASLLWKYATATGLFALSNIFAYYYLSLDQYVPVVISSLFGMLQIALVVLFHSSLEQIVLMQIIAMLGLLFIQLGFFGFRMLKDRNIAKS